MNLSPWKFLSLIVATAMALTGMSSIAAAAPDRDPVPPPTDYWQGDGIYNLAHQGGEQEAPGNTMFAYRTAMAAGADVIDCDAWVTSDGHVVLTHDRNPGNTSNAAPDSDGPNNDVTEMTLAKLRSFDFGYWFTPFYGTYYSKSDTSKPHPYRGIATGDRPAPKGFTADDFKITTFSQLLDAFPDTPINIEIKTPDSSDSDYDAYTTRAARAMADVLKAHPGREKDVIINSFAQDALTKFHADDPAHLAFSGSEDGLLGYITGDPIDPTPVAVEPPDQYDLGGVGWVSTVPILKPLADYDGYKIFVWSSDHDPLEETWPYFAKLLAQGADGFDTTRPSVLNAFLCNTGVRRPDGTQRCPGQTPDPCPAGTTGTPPVCVPVEPEKTAKLNLIGLPVKKKVRVGHRFPFHLLIQNTGDLRMGGVKVCFSTGRAGKKKFKLPRCSRAKGVNPLHEGNGPSGQNPIFTRMIRARGKGRGRAAITAIVTTANGGQSKVRRKVRVKPRKSKKHGSQRARSSED